MECTAKVVLWTDTPISAVELCSSIRVILGLFVASLINALLSWSVGCGVPDLFGELLRLHIDACLVLPLA